MSAPELKPRLLHWFALFLLVASVCINYADRGNLGVAGTKVQAELHLNSHTFGLLMGAFSITYALSQLGTAKLIDRFNVNWLYALAFLAWSGATAVTGIVSSFAILFALRLILGFSESLAYPAYAKMMVVSFPEKLRGTANGLIDAGSKMGPAVGLWVGSWIIGRYDWRAMFRIIGLASLIWLVPWCLVAGRLPHKIVDHTESIVQPAGYSKLLRCRKFWGTAIGLFGGNYVWFFLLYWLPGYLERDRHYSREHLTNVGTLCYLTIALASGTFGFLADWFIHRGHTAGPVRRLSMCSGLLLCCPLMYAAANAPDESSSTLLLLLTFIALGGWSSNHWALSQLLAGSATAGQWTGLQNCIGNFAGIAAPWVTGWVVDATGSFYGAFILACGMLLLSAASYWFVVGTPSQVFDAIPSGQSATAGMPAGERQFQH